MRVPVEAASRRDVTKRHRKYRRGAATKCFGPDGILPWTPPHTLRRRAGQVVGGRGGAAAEATAGEHGVDAHLPWFQRQDVAAPATPAVPAETSPMARPDAPVSLMKRSRLISVPVAARIVGPRLPEVEMDFTDAQLAGFEGMRA